MKLRDLYEAKPAFKTYLDFDKYVEDAAAIGWIIRRDMLKMPESGPALLTIDRRQPSVCALVGAEEGGSAIIHTYGPVIYDDKTDELLHEGDKTFPDTEEGYDQAVEWFKKALTR